MLKFDWNDVSIVPSAISTIDSRSEISILKDGKLPLFTAPMDMVIDENNVDYFSEQGLNICLPRNVKYENLKNDNYFYSYGLDEILNYTHSKSILPKKVLIDVANGHMSKLLEASKLIKERYPDTELMVGNIANPETYREYCKIGVDYIRVGIGGGSACTTSANVSIHYPMASLINECYEISKEFKNPTKIIADGGFKSYSDIIKALALGADYCMLGSVLNKCLESCSPIYIKHGVNYGTIDLESANEIFENKVRHGNKEIYKYYRGMSTKEVQKVWDRKELKTAEGISKYNVVEYTLEGWCNNFSDYLKSAMSYTNSRTLEEYIGKVKWIKISQNAFNRFNK